MLEHMIQTILEVLILCPMIGFLSTGIAYAVIDKWFREKAAYDAAKAARMMEHFQLAQCDAKTTLKPDTPDEKDAEK